MISLCSHRHLTGGSVRVFSSRASTMRRWQNVGRWKWPVPVWRQGAARPLPQRPPLPHPLPIPRRRIANLWIPTRILNCDSSRCGERMCCKGFAGWKRPIEKTKRKNITLICQQIQLLRSKALCWQDQYFQVIWRKRGFLITVTLCKHDAKEMIYIIKETQLAFPLQFIFFIIWGYM